MSLSNPSIQVPHPNSTWFEWNGAHGVIEYYDKESKKRIQNKPPFAFIVLDQLSVVKGWSDQHNSGITSNEVRDTRTDVMTVRTFTNVILATGLYANIKERITSKAVGGHYTNNIYCAIKRKEGLVMASLQIKGAALGAWMEFSKKNRAAINESAINITGSTLEQNGAVKFYVPKFEIVTISEASLQQAIALDKKLQEYLTSYFARTTKETVVVAPKTPDQEYDDAPQDVPDDLPPDTDVSDNDGNPFED